MELEIRPTFLEAALAMEKPVRQGIAKMVRLAAQLPMAELLNHQGVHLERLKGRQTAGGEPLYTLRATRAARAVAALRGETLILLYVEADHDEAYRP